MPADLLERIDDHEAEFASVGSLASAEDMALVDAARRRDPEAFEVLVTRYGQHILRITQGITRNREDAEDVSQDSFARAFLHLDTFRGESCFSTWLTRIAINQSLMKLRARRGRELSLDLHATAEEAPLRAEVADDAPTPEQRYAQEELHHILALAIGELPMHFREILHLREIEERSTGETAGILGLSIADVKSRGHRGRQKLRRILTKYFHRSGLPGFPGSNSV